MRALRQFPLQNKSLSALDLPWLRVGVCELMNSQPLFAGASFITHNSLNCQGNRPFGQIAGVGIFDSYGSAHCSSFVSRGIEAALRHHVSDPVKDAALLHSLPKSPLRDMKQTIREMRKRAQYG